MRSRYGLRRLAGSKDHQHHERGDYQRGGEHDNGGGLYFHLAVSPGLSTLESFDAVVRSVYE